MKLSVIILSAVISAIAVAQIPNKQIDNSQAKSIIGLDSNYIGQTLLTVIKELKLDTSQFFAFDEPPLILTGIDIQTPKYQMKLWVERTAIMDKPYLGFRQQYIYIKDKKVIKVTRTTN